TAIGGRDLKAVPCEEDFDGRANHRIVIDDENMWHAGPPVRGALDRSRLSSACTQASYSRRDRAVCPLSGIGTFSAVPLSARRHSRRCGSHRSISQESCPDPSGAYRCHALLPTNIATCCVVPVTHASPLSHT